MHTESFETGVVDKYIYAFLGATDIRGHQVDVAGHAPCPIVRPTQRRRNAIQVRPKGINSVSNDKVFSAGDGESTSDAAEVVERSVTFPNRVPAMFWLFSVESQSRRDCCCVMSVELADLGRAVPNAWLALLIRHGCD